MGIEEYLKGRKLLKEEIPQMYHDALESSNIKKQKGMIVSGNQVICQRCLSKSTTYPSLVSVKRSIPSIIVINVFYWAGLRVVKHCIQ